MAEQGQGAPSPPRVCVSGWGEGGGRGREGKPGAASGARPALAGGGALLSGRGQRASVVTPADAARRRNAGEEAKKPAQKGTGGLSDRPPRRIDAVPHGDDGRARSPCQGIRPRSTPENQCFLKRGRTGTRTPSTTLFWGRFTRSLRNLRAWFARSSRAFPPSPRPTSRKRQLYCCHTTTTMDFPHAWAGTQRGDAWPKTNRGYAPEG